MKLLRRLLERQHELGFLSDETLREIAAEARVPLYRLEGLVSFYPAFRRSPPPAAVVHVCRDVSCAMAGGADALKSLQDAVSGQDVEICEVSCLGRCDAAPAIAINDCPLAPTTLAELPDVQARIAEASAGSETPADESGPPPKERRCDPYATEGERYSAAFELAGDLDNLATTCISRLTESGLRGMGGAGFPTGRKWELVRSEPADPKYVICNADESEPGTFKDREILATLPHLVIEGMLLAGLTVGAEQGIVYLRHEYEPERRKLEHAIAAARARGVLGANAAGSGRPFDIEIFVSPGGYILGEETALLEALEDKRGEPRNKPPYPGSYGLWGQPTLINNVETFAFATTIVRQGTDWWRDQGVGQFSGLKFVSVSGDVEQPGVYEIPVGLTVRELIEQAGGMKAGKPLRAFLPGGASSHFLPADRSDTPLDFEAVRQAGSMLGTGAVIVIAEGRPLFPLAANLVRFFRNESCGKCVPCRVGSDKAAQLLDEVWERQRSPAALAVLPELGATLEQTSICGLGQVALQPILSLLELFPDEAPA